MNIEHWTTPESPSCEAEPALLGEVGGVEGHARCCWQWCTSGEIANINIGESLGVLSYILISGSSFIFMEINGVDEWKSIGNYNFSLYITLLYIFGKRNPRAEKQFS